MRRCLPHVWPSGRTAQLSARPSLHSLSSLGHTPALLLCLAAADYRVPVVLRELGLLSYAPELAAAVDGRRELAAGSREETEIRAATVEAVERLRAALAARLAAEGRAGAAAPRVNSVQLDWWLWEAGERDRTRHRPHHRVLTVYY